MINKIKQNKKIILEKYQKGWGTPRIASLIGVNSGTIYRFLKESKIELRKVPSIDIFGKPIVVLYELGFSLYKISKELKLNFSTVERYAKKLGLNTKRYSKNV